MGTNGISPCNKKETYMFTLTVLIENISKRDDLIPAKGLSILLEDGEKRVLLDTGTGGDFLKNARTLGIQLDTIDQVVLSHGHYDHAGGIPALGELVSAQHHRPTLTCHPDCFIERHFGRITNGKPLCIRKLDAGLHEDEIRETFIVQDSKEPVLIEDKFLFLGEIPRSPNFKGGGAFGIARHDGAYVDDFLYDDTGIVWKGRDGLVIITGCSHSGICNVITRAQEVTGEKRIAAIVGGLHLHAAPVSQLMQIRNFFNKVKVQRSFACHCTGKWGAAWLPRNTAITTGDVLTFE